MAEFRISRIRYTWRDAWTNGITYNRDDIVRYGGSTWICQRQHVSTAFAVNQAYLANQNDTQASPAWFLMSNGRAWRNTWNANTLYDQGDLALYGGVIYLCVTSHTSQATFEPEDVNWAVYLSADNWRTDWTAATRYGIGDVVKYNGTVYRCIAEHTSSTITLGLEIGNNDNEDDSAGELWQDLYQGIEVVGVYTANIRYRQNDLVKYGGSILRCVTGHVSTAGINNNNFITEFAGNKFYQTWSSIAYYAVGDIVRHGGFLYVANVNVYQQNPAADDVTQWNILSKAVDFMGQWSSTVSYKPGDLVRRGGNLYLATAATTNDGSSLDYLDSGNWELFTVSQNPRGAWSEAAVYGVNDVVTFFGSTYACNFEHAATDQNFPGDNGSGFFYWDLLLQAGSAIGMTTRGDLLTFNLSKTLQGDTSTFGPTNVPIGQFNQVLTVSNDDEVEYSSVGQIARTVFVAKHGIDSTSDSFRGYSVDTPWRSIRYACRQVDDGFQGHTTVEVSTGIYEEITPIIIPAKTVVLGAELRSTTIQASASVLSTVDRPVHVAVLNRISQLIQDILAGVVLNPSKTPGNALNPVVLSGPNQPLNPRQFDFDGNEILDPTVKVYYTDPAAAVAIQNKIIDIQSYINFRVNSSGVDATLAGTNTASMDIGYTNVSLILEANRMFLQAEVTAFISSSYPQHAYDATQLAGIIDEYIDAWKYDTVYNGNYKSLLAARYYTNSVLGCQESEDMFYCRNATGLRNCTLTGLESTLNPPVAFDLYQKPLGGAYVSLDPGWGPADERVWITTRSPYIQGVTTIGTGCVGQKIDGALHNGGNKSITSNDFTQVLSDGIGAWVTNNGRAELVSVFTYYAHIGYLAEDGGTIRATNGNCSYGTYGAVADGVDASETPLTAAVYVRAQEAQVAAAFAGDFVDEIQILEFNNCGEQYTNAVATFSGAGVNAAVLFEDFRDDAVFEARLLDKNITGAVSIGGGGYVLAQNNAQTGTATTITIASNDANTIAQYVGMRIIITSGAGTGQYGYVVSYDSVSKIIDVYRESDDQPGWDHVVPGKLPQVPLATNTVYRIEPRVIFSEPAYAAVEITVPTATTWSEIAYGETTLSFNNVSVNESGTGTTIDVLAALASFNVTKIGRVYTISINNSGAGYEVNQLLTIDGDQLGGATPVNDLVIEVTAVSDDSTNSIVAAQPKTYGTGEDNQAASGKFVVVSTAGSAALYSSNGTEWTSFNMPSAGDWTCLAAGNNRFVAIRQGSAVAASSLNGVTWTARTMPASRQWKSCVYGGGVFLAVATDSNSAAYSSNGTTWTTVVLPAYGDSTLNQWTDIAYGRNTFVVLANSGNTVAAGTYNLSSNTWSWIGHTMDVIADSTQVDWTSITYGNGRFVAVSSTGDVAYSFDAVYWLPAGMPSQDGSTAHYWKKIRYAQGVFFAVGDTGSRTVGGDPSAPSTNFAATSFDGVVWSERQLASSQVWQSVAFGNPYIDARDSTVGQKTPVWIAIDISNKFNKIQTGARALGRVTLGSGIIRSIKMWDPGSGYTEGPVCTIVDPNNGVNDAVIESRTGDGVLAQPTWLNRGLGYRTASTRVIINGDGWASVIPSGKFIVINDLSTYPGPGANVTITGLPNSYTLVALEQIGPTDRGLAARIRLSPEIKVRDNLSHLQQVTIRTQFSQCRITGHDFLDVGTGNFQDTNYPALYSGFYTPEPQDEIVELNRGRVFYTSTDQSGNFRAGELFAVEQATGVVTISADFFDLNGLSELRLGGIRVGGTGAVVREFSTDPLFVADSNNIVPTQRAIAAYLANRLSVGGSEIAVGSFIAGTILVGPDRINNVAQLRVIFPVRAEFDMPQSGISGSILAQTMFYRSFK